MKTAIIGAGTIIFQDEGVGVYASKYIEQNYTFLDDVTLVDGGVLGFGLMPYYQEYDKVIILDTLTIDDSVGSIYNLPSEELLGLGSYKQTAHEVEIVEMLEICSLLEKMADVNIIGIVPKDIITVGVGLTDELKEKFDAFISAAMDEVERNGISYRKNDTLVSLETILENYANPKSEQI
ncbi:HyaD/HybD family hydrogenase maturation endopeptidase [Sulfurimonas sp. C5]|uniref:HyaD/HybD family hydrogenase maturation endopeptidase n=1 Tax=Sulfurimonas sp. C5 TaxID=3036947 RepID=UPI002457F7EB|nr:HyaD/HybD family hydrogenase maturation endopeptidase [Sulfurimonas sp. C5]MDH4943616.1 HyaD/HybD family hydrogenase maturation endopeptidase [Sulfurimonas sp. C5]